MHLNRYDCLGPRELPRECIAECSASGDVTAAIEYWVDRLDLTVDTHAAIDYLVEFGAWEIEELESWDNRELAARILWIAACNLAEDRALGIADPIWYFGH